jgi:Zn finger protein HypA/HybF involved in hydrogenase expression
MKNFLIIVLLLFMVQVANAQSHVSKSEYARYNCRFAPKGWNNSEGKLMCPACDKENEDARKKKIADDKAASEANKIKNEKLKAENAIAFKKKQAEYAAKNKVTEVHVTMGKTPVTDSKKTEAPVKKGPVKLGKDIQLYAGWGMGMFTHNARTNFFLNENKDTVLKSNDYLEAYAVMGENKNNFPKNIGIVLLKETNKISNGREQNVADIVDLKGKRYFSDNTISTIFHLADDYFVVCKSPTLPEWRSYGNNYTGYENVEIYNLKTKKSIKLDKDAGRFVSISIYVGGRKLAGEPDLIPFLSRVYINYDEDVYCLNANREMVVKKILKADR